MPVSLLTLSNCDPLAGRRSFHRANHLLGMLMAHAEEHFA
jgi:hypothetical protein